MANEEIKRISLKDHNNDDRNHVNYIKSFLFLLPLAKIENKYVVEFSAVQFPYGRTRLQRCSHPVVRFFLALSERIKMLTTVEDTWGTHCAHEKYEKVCSFVVMSFKNKDNTIQNPTTNLTTT